jgi:DNA-binding NarL/FixJ family response regulator
LEAPRIVLSWKGTEAIGGTVSDPFDGSFPVPAEEVGMQGIMARSEEPAERVLIVDPQPLFADLLRLGLDTFAFSAMAATSASVALEWFRRDPPSLVLIEVTLPDGSGLQVGRQMLAWCPDARLLVLSEARDPRTIAEALDIGFCGYLTKDLPLERLVGALRAASAGQVILPRELARAPRSEGIILRLTAREREVLRMLVEGLSSRDMARCLYLSPHTVRSHVQSVLAKLGVHSRLEAVALVMRNGIRDTLYTIDGPDQSPPDGIHAFA